MCKKPRLREEDGPDFYSEGTFALQNEYALNAKGLLCAQKRGVGRAMT